MRFFSFQVAILIVLIAVRSAAADSDHKAVHTQHAPPHHVFRSAHFTVHTDLPAAQARPLLERLEATLAWAEAYWGRRGAGAIECYVVADLRHWPTLPAVARAKIAQRAGVTLTETLTLNGQHVAAKAVVYAPAEGGSLEHETVHAYCGQTWGATGPLWYAEGMAEVGQYARGDGAVDCPPGVLDYLKRTRPPTIAKVVGASATTGDGWRNYAWRWALCQMLVDNPNYAARFRALGIGLLENRPTDFGQSFGAAAHELEFEYRLFLTNLQRGYRVDLCRWDWKRRFKTLPAGAKADCRVLAERGWQPTGVLVKVGDKYDVVTAGRWRTGLAGSEVDASGSPQGTGRLVAAILADYRLSEPFEVGGHGTFVASRSGKLYLRCQDSWGELADNEGSITVRIRPSQK